MAARIHTHRLDNAYWAMVQGNILASVKGSDLQLFYVADLRANPVRSPERTEAG
jgi:hypothetical protein